MHLHFIFEHPNSHYFTQNKKKTRITCFDKEVDFSFNHVYFAKKHSKLFFFKKIFAEKEGP